MLASHQNLVARVLTAAVGLPIVGLFIYLPDTRYLLGLATCLCGAALWEFSHLALREGTSSERLGVIVLGILFFLGLYALTDKALPLAMGTLLLLGLWMIPRRSELLGRLQRLFAAGFGIFYVAGLLVALPLLHREAGPAWLALAVALTFANDTGAYFVGRAIGRHKLAPSISPGKTWEGAVGGLAASMLLVLAGRALILPQLAFTDVLLIALPTAVLGPVGDLMESLFKRTVGAKDSGRIFPGHGGVLDRIDALLFVGAYVYLYATQLR